MAMCTIRFSALGVALLLLLVRAAWSQDGTVWLWNDDARKLGDLLEVEWKNPPASDADATTPLRQMPPRELWKLAESAGLFPEVPDGYSSFEKTAALHSLLTALESHPKKSEFVSLMLDAITKTTVPTRKPRDWNEISVHSHGGIAGELIEGVMRVAESSEHRRIVEAIAATKDREKVNWLRTEVRRLTDGADLERLLDRAESGAREPAVEKIEEQRVLQHTSSSDSGHSADTEVQIPAISGKMSLGGDPLRLQGENASPTQKSLIVAFLVAVPSVLWLFYKRRSAR